MAKYLLEASYTAEGLKGLQKDGAAGRRAAVEQAVQSAGGKVECMYYALGDRDVIVVLDLPGVVDAAAVGLATSASGLVRTRITALLSIEETDQAIAKRANYRAPGS